MSIKVPLVSVYVPAWSGVRNSWNQSICFKTVKKHSWINGLFHFYRGDVKIQGIPWFFPGVSVSIYIFPGGKFAVTKTDFYQKNLVPKIGKINKKNCIICCVLAEIPYLGKFLFLRYGLKNVLSHIRLQDFLINNISRTDHWNSWFFAFWCKFT